MQSNSTGLLSKRKYNYLRRKEIPGNEPVLMDASLVFLIIQAYVLNYAAKMKWQEQTQWMSMRLCGQTKALHTHLSGDPE